MNVRALSVIGRGLVAAALVAVAGCGGGAEPDGPVPVSTATPSPPVSSGPEATIEGTMVAGVEPGCLLLNTGDRSYLLIGGDPVALRPGAKLLVRGVPKPDVPNTCQQGIPFAVIGTQPAG